MVQYPHCNCNSSDTFHMKRIGPLLPSHTPGKWENGSHAWSVFVVFRFIRFFAGHIQGELKFSCLVPLMAISDAKGTF